MRLLHFSDVHIGVENYTRVDPETGLSSRLMDFLATLDEVVTYATDARVDLVLFCGDAYKSRDPSQTHQREFARRIARLSAAGIPVFLVVGNHDMPHVIGRATALEIFQTLVVPNVYIADSLGVQVVQTRSGPLQVLALPWVRRSSFLRREETRGLTPEGVNKAIEERLTQALQVQAQGLDSSIPAIFAGHVTVSGAVTSSEQSMMLGRDHVLLKSSVALPGIDYVALGHIHKHQVLGREPFVVYSGSLQRVDFGEEGDEKGFCVIELDPGKPAGLRLRDFEFRHVNARSFLTIAVPIPQDDPDPTATVVQAIQRHNIQGAIVRLKIAVPGALDGHLREREIRDALSGAQFVASIHKEIVQQPQSWLGQAYSAELSLRDVLRRYFESQKVAPERVELLMQHMERLQEDTASD